MIIPDLPRDFLFGVATAAAQIEGAAGEAGRGPSIWDVFAAAPGRIADGSNTGVAVDHYHRVDTDVALLAELGVQAYRFSVSWSRVQPGGAGPANPAGLDFYDRLVDRLLDRHIQPWLTLYHWDLPAELMLDGGWLERDTADRFGDYTALVAERLGDRITGWMTLNEPAVHMAYGHALGVEAPGLALLGGAFAASHHQLLGHARAVQVLRDSGFGPVGIVNHHTTVAPLTSGPADRRAADLYDAFHNGQFADPVLLGHYPAPLESLPGVDFGLVADGDLAAISVPLDFYGVNFYHPTLIADAPGNTSIPFTMADMTGVPMTDHEWPVVPSALTDLLVGLQHRYPRLPPVYITENGAAYDDVEPTGAATGRPDRLPSDRARHDQARIDYLDSHLAAVAAAGRPGSTCAGISTGH